MKCSSCGKSFDYEKYYGICPKCGTYNKKPVTQEQQNQGYQQNAGYRQSNESYQQQYESFQQQNQQERQDFQQAQWDARQQQANNGQWQNMNMPLTPEEQQKIVRRKTACIVLGILTAVCVVLGVVIITVGQHKLGEVDTTVVTDVTALEAPVTPEDKTFGESFVVDEDTGIEVAFDQVEVLCEANVESEFPENEKLVSVLVKGTGSKTEWDYDAGLSDPVGSIYEGYGDVFESEVSSYDLEDYQEYIGGKLDMSTSSLKYDNETGYLYFFLPEEVNEFYLYVEQRDVNTNQVLKVYRVPTTLGAAVQEGVKDEQ